MTDWQKNRNHCNRCWKFWTRLSIINFLSILSCLNIGEYNERNFFEQLKYLSLRKAWMLFLKIENLNMKKPKFNFLKADYFKNFLSFNLIIVMHLYWNRVFSFHCLKRLSNVQKILVFKFPFKLIYIQNSILYELCFEYKRGLNFVSNYLGLSSFQILLLFCMPVKFILILILRFK